MRSLHAKPGAALKRLPPTKKHAGARPSANRKSSVPAPDPALTGTQKRGFGVFKRGPNAA